MTVHHVFIEPQRLAPWKQHFTACLAVSNPNGDDSFDPLVSTSSDPEFDACRVLAGRGLEGAVQFYFRGKPSLRFKDLREAAQKRVIETAQGGPRVGKWKAFPEVVSE